jgi:hypothetical protein
MKEPQSFEKLRATHPVTQNHFQEDLNPQPYCAKNLKYFMLEEMLKNAKNKGITLSINQNTVVKQYRKL